MTTSLLFALLAPLGALLVDSDNGHMKYGKAVQG